MIHFSAVPELSQADRLSQTDSVYLSSRCYLYSLIPFLNSESWSQLKTLRVVTDIRLSACRNKTVVSLCCSVFSAGLYMNQMGYPAHPYGGSFHSLGQIGGMMPSQMATVGRSQSSMAIGSHQNGMMAVAQQAFVSGMIRPHHHHPQQHHQHHQHQHQQGAMMGHQQNGLAAGQQQQQQQHNPLMVGQQPQPMGGLAGLPPHGQQAQQLQWNVAQVGSVFGTSPRSCYKDLIRYVLRFCKYKIQDSFFLDIIIFSGYYILCGVTLRSGFYRCTMFLCFFCN